MSINELNNNGYDNSFASKDSTTSNTSCDSASKYDYYKEQADNNGENFIFERYASSLTVDGQDRGDTIFAHIDTDNDYKIGRGFGSDYDAYCGFEYVEEWAQDSFVYKVADDMDNDGNYDVKYFDSQGNISISGIDTDLDGIIDQDVVTNNNCDGKIDAFSQGNTGDCWLLSGIQAMSSSKEGAEILKNAIDVQSDGSTIVHTYFGDYTISLDELKEAKLSINVSDDRTYSAGDDDVLVLELAAEKVLNDLKDGKVKFSGTTGVLESVRNLIHSFSNDSNEISINDNFTGVFNYIMTGKQTSYNVTKIQMNKALNDLENGKSMSASFSSLLNRTLSGPDGDVYIAGNHTYAIKEVKDGVVTLINPWDADKEIKVYKDGLTKYLNSIETVKY